MRVWIAASCAVLALDPSAAFGEAIGAVSAANEFVLGTPPGEQQR